MNNSKPAQEGQPEILSRPANKRTPSRVRTFLNTYAECGNIKAAAKAAGISRDTHYHRLETDAAYRRAFDATENQIGQELEELAIDRVRNGIKRQLFHNGKPMRQNGRLVYEAHYDTSLHITMLKRFRPALYREHTSVEHSGSINLVERLEQARARLLKIKREEDDKKTG